MNSVTEGRSAQDRRLRIELLRLQAGYERLRFTHSACALAHSLRPDALMARAHDHLSGMGLGWLDRGLGLVRRFPVVLSLASALLSGPGRRRVLVKSVLIGSLLWLARRPSRKDGAPS
ncbi:hypothetical protein CDEF62S_02512 [Castellaniella defragrans]